jgi:hypothetical protein
MYESKFSPPNKDKEKEEKKIYPSRADCSKDGYKKHRYRNFEEAVDPSIINKEKGEEILLLNAK